MIPQGDAVLNAKYFDDIIERVDNANSCQDLQDAVNTAFASINAQQQAILDQLEALLPILALLDPPSDPAEVITWVLNFITSYLTPALKPYTNYALQVAQMTAKIAELTSAIENASNRFNNCTVSIPSPL
jgi:hypothetical protein